MKRSVILSMAVATMVAMMAPSAPARTVSDRTGHSSPAAPARPALSKVPIITGLNFPSGFTFFPDGRIIFGIRSTGDIDLFDPSTQQTSLLFHITNVVSNGEQGLLGLAVHPGWPAKPFVYAYATRDIGGGTLRNQILRIKVKADKGVSSRRIFQSDTTAGDYHDGGRIAFGPDGKLYAVVGEGHSPANAQNMSNNAGKVLRMTKLGKAPQDNPFPGKLIFTFGLRNSFGFTFDPQSGLMWETENGPECNDEVNLEQVGENHAWGSNETCSGQPPQNTNQDGPQPRIMPLAYFVTTIAPTGTVFCDSCGLTNAEGDLFFGAYNTGEIREVRLTQDRKGISSLFVAYPNSESILSMEQAPDGTLCFSTPTGIYRLVQA